MLLTSPKLIKDVRLAGVVLGPQLWHPCLVLSSGGGEVNGVKRESWVHAVKTTKYGRTPYVRLDRARPYMSSQDSTWAETRCVTDTQTNCFSQRAGCIVSIVLSTLYMVVLFNF